MDARSKEEKPKVSWTHALRQIIINCCYHAREDLPARSEEDEKANAAAAANAGEMEGSGETAAGGGNSVGRNF
jgi:nuclear respiratory factor 1